MGGLLSFIVAYFNLREDVTACAMMVTRRGKGKHGCGTCVCKCVCESRGVGNGKSVYQH